MQSLYRPLAGTIALCPSLTGMGTGTQRVFISAASTVTYESIGGETITGSAPDLSLTETVARPRRPGGQIGGR